MLPKRLFKCDHPINERELCLPSSFSYSLIRLSRRKKINFSHSIFAFRFGWLGHQRRYVCLCVSVGRYFFLVASSGDEEEECVAEHTFCLMIFVYLFVHGMFMSL